MGSVSRRIRENARSNAEGAKARQNMRRNRRRVREQAVEREAKARADRKAAYASGELAAVAGHTHAPRRKLGWLATLRALVTGKVSL